MFPPVSLILFIFLVQNSCLVLATKNALSYFVKKFQKRFKDAKVAVFQTNESNITWFEHSYFFQSDFDKENEENEENFYGKLLRVGFTLEDSFDFDCNANYTGYSFNIIKWFAKQNNISYQLVELNSTDIQGGLLNEDVDIVICHHHKSMIDIDDNQYLFQLHPTLKSRYLLIYKPSQLYFTKDIFILTFAGSLWLVFFVLLIVLAICLRISTIKYSRIHPNYQPWSWVEITLWAIAAACQQGLSYTPSGFASCLIFLIGYVTAYLLYTGFEAAITSLLLQHDAYYKLNPTLDSYKFNLLYFIDDFHTQTFRRQFKTSHFIKNIKKFFNKLQNDYNTIGLAPEIIINHYLHEQKENFVSYKLNLQYSTGFYILRNSTFRKTLTLNILRIEENGWLQNSLNRHLQPELIANVDSGYSSAGLEHVGSAILILVAGILAALLFLLIECGFVCYKRNRRILFN